MTAVAEIRLWDRTVGEVFLRDGTDVAVFQYNPAFAAGGIQPAPLTMPLSTQSFSFPALNESTFYGLPGLLADSLPDKFGNALLNVWLARQRRSPESFTAIDRLCFMGTRGMGALEYVPAIGLADRVPAFSAIDKLVRLISRILRAHTYSVPSSEDGDAAAVMSDLLQVGISAGGARAKGVIGWNPETDEICAGHVEPPPGFEPWLIKFDGVAENRDKESADPTGFGSIEYAYYLMARDAGISMSESRLFEEGGRRHFMTRRFDRTADGEKVHMQSLGAMAHFDFNSAGAHSYEQAIQVLRRIDAPPEDAEEQFRRMVFNIAARNQDDHVKNIAFLMDKSGNWRLAPAYDLTYSFNPKGAWTATHQMTLCGKRDRFFFDDFTAFERTVSLKAHTAERIVAEVISVVSRWQDYADEAGVHPVRRDQIRRQLRLTLSPVKSPLA